METKDKAYKIGCGRYIQEYGCIADAGKEIRTFGKRALVIGGRTALALVGGKLKKSLEEAGVEAVFREYTGYCCIENAEKIMENAELSDIDVVVGVGGGNIMDAAKLTAHTGGRRLKVVNIPTSSATCAAYTALSVTYDSDGRCRGSVKYNEPVDAVICDMDILASQPVRLAAAGMFDALAKLIETSQRMAEIPPENLNPGLEASYCLSGYIYRKLFEIAPQAMEDFKAGIHSKAVYDTVYISIAVTGAVSGMARGSDQCAIAHKFYEVTRTMFPRESAGSLHGEIVALGLLIQLAYNGNDSELEVFAESMKKYGMPLCLGEMSLPSGRDVRERYYDLICNTHVMKNATAAECERLRDALEKILVEEESR